MDSLRTVEEWSEEQLENRLKKFAEERELGLGKIIHPTRLALTGVPNGPSSFSFNGDSRRGNLFSKDSDRS